MVKAHLLAGVSSNAVARSRGAVRNAPHIAADLRKILAQYGMRA